MERLQKFLAGAGVCSRRTAEDMILAGRVTVNGARVTRMGTQVDPERDAVKVDGKRIRPTPGPLVYFLLNKPKGVVTTVSDPEGRPTVADYFPRGTPRLFPVGRLDFQSEGLLLLTNDGALARKLTHPSSRISKTYKVKLRGTPSPQAIQRLEKGIVLEKRKTGPARIRQVKSGKNPWFEIQVSEGRKHLVRLLFGDAGHPVLKLRRVGFGPLHLGALPVGKTRRLTETEVAVLRQGSNRSRREKPSAPPRANRP